MAKKIDIKSIKAVGFDLDGVVYFGKKLAPGVRKVIHELRSRGLRIFYITNNSSKTREEIRAKLSALGIAAGAEEIFTSGYACASFLNKLKKRIRVFVLGSRGLKKVFLQEGLDLSGNIKCDYLAVGFDPKFNYDKLTLGLRVIKSGARFIACNLDRTFPGDSGKLFPGCGAIVAALASASGRNPDFIIGKPSTYMLELVSGKFSLKAKEIIFIGDSLETDIPMANKFGSLSVLIARNKPVNLNKIMKPAFTISSLYGLIRLLRIGGK
ncbi:MAG: HAD-IIA family hydrolase [Candidatus Omnitrophota bacterium]|jgi:NagD protein